MAFVSLTSLPSTHPPLLHCTQRALASLWTLDGWAVGVLGLSVSGHVHVVTQESWAPGVLRSSDSGLSGPPHPPPRLAPGGGQAALPPLGRLETGGVSGLPGWPLAPECSVVSDSATPRTAACQAPQSMGFPRQEYWSGLPFPPPGDLPHPGIESPSPALQVGSLPLSHQGSPLSHCP